MKYFFLSLVFVLGFCSNSAAQCHMDRHNTSGKDAWLSCTATTNPNSNHGVSHWIMYDLGYEYDLADLKVWNANVPDSTDRGVEHLIVDFSLNGTDWTFLDEVDLQESNGSSTYEGETIMNFNGQRARYVLLTATSNHGATCYSLSEIKINIANTVVPISLVSFNLRCKAGEIEISWQTEDEQNNDHFEIQRKTLETDWRTIGQVPGQEYRGKALNYVYIDKENVNTESAIYRLVQIDLNGARSFFEAATISCNEQQQAFKVYPNPASDRLEVLFQGSEKGQVVLRLINNLGQQLELFNIGVNEKTDIDISQLKPGNYLLKIERGAVVYVRNVVKI